MEDEDITEVVQVDLADDVRAGEDEEVVVALELLGMALELLSYATATSDETQKQKEGRGMIYNRTKS